VVPEHPQPVVEPAPLPLDVQHYVATHDRLWGETELEVPVEGVAEFERQGWKILRRIDVGDGMVHIVIETEL
jgi:hypothetical protein